MNTKSMQTLDYASKAELVLLTLRDQNTSAKITYSDLARAIGLLGEQEQWEPRHRNLISDVINVMYFSRRWCFGKKADGYDDPDELWRMIVTKTKGEPSPGVFGVNITIDKGGV